MRRALLIAFLASCASAPPPYAADPIGDADPESIGTVHLGKITIKGGAEGEDVSSSVDAARADISGCYQSELDENPALDGNAALLVELSAEGKSTRVAFSRDAFGASNMLSCIQAASQEWSFPPSTMPTRFVEIELVFELVP